MGAVPAQPVPRLDPEIVDVGTEVLASGLAPVVRMRLTDPARAYTAPRAATGAQKVPVVEPFPFADPAMSSSAPYIAPEWARLGPQPAPTSELARYVASDPSRYAPRPTAADTLPFLGSRRHVDLELDGSPVPFRITLSPAIVGELVEVRYRSGGWRAVDELIDAAQTLYLTLAQGARASPQALKERLQEVLRLLELLRDGAADLAKRVVRPLVQAELLARREVLRRLDTSTGLLAYDFGRLAPNGRYARYQDWENRRSLTPARFLAELAEHPWEPEEDAPEFAQLTALIDELGRARNWAASVRLKGAASFTATIMASVQGLLQMLDQEPGTLERAARTAVARIQELADALSGKARTTGPIPPLHARGTLGAEFTLAVDEAQRATQLVLITETALGAVFPLARRLDTAALAGAKGEQLRLACAAAGAKVASDAAAIEAGLGLSATSVRHLTDERADLATGKDSAASDAFTYPVAVYAALEQAGMEMGSLPWTAAGEAMRARGIPSSYTSVWESANLAAGFASVLAKKAGPAAAVSAAAYSVWDAGVQTMTFWHGARTWNAVIEPALRLIEKDPELSDLALAYGSAFIDVVGAAMEVAPLFMAAAL
ncbi:hypothetical protein G6045_11820 [Streptomyces sp. YC504]|uniref:Uncharacterized protein n=1 Tax=Streptomyces mesophilus TaxID=1775132 RepID=A0A6G4XGN7_9ACTN|nr:hypothetical protein [Streptomyces mesophilus]NGO76342.1 hypothetical protein [Streptomyces mesophilus]